MGMGKGFSGRRRWRRIFRETGMLEMKAMSLRFRATGAGQDVGAESFFEE